MKQITVISGKGGTGKTSITAAFASLSKDAVIADCDVDAPDLHLILKPNVIKEENFYGHDMPVIDKEKCINCGLCRENCRFDAITDDIEIIEERCEGCGVCEYVCPINAITMKKKKSGKIFSSITRFGPMTHAKLETGEETSGLLVSFVREKAKAIAEREKKDIIIIDGPPGIGCPVIASITGVNLVLIVTEPTMSGLHDLERILDVSDHFGVPSVICINKYNINKDMTNRIEKYCNKKGIEIIGKIPFTKKFTEAMINGQTVVEYDKELRDLISNVWKILYEKIKKD